MVTYDLVEKLRVLGVFPNTLEDLTGVREIAQIFEQCTHLENIELEMIRSRDKCLFLFKAG